MRMRAGWIPAGPFPKCKSSTSHLFLLILYYFLPMRLGPSARFLSPGLSLLILVLLVAPSGAAPIYAVQGEDIPLSGTAPGLDFIYLFLTGPNLPDPGISLVGGTPVATGNPASFTRVEVSTDGTWAYTWRTGSLGRILDPGTYVIYIVEGPLGRPDLDDAVFATQVVVLGAPAETVTATLTVMTTGSLAVDSSPGMSAVTMDGNPAGITPLVISDIPAGSHTLVISRRGYVDYRVSITISPGERREISAALQSLAPTPVTTTGPPVATPPGRLAPLSLVAPGAAALAILILHRRW
jgi:hypothetical protein